MSKKRHFAIKLPSYAVYGVASLLISAIIFWLIIFLVPEGGFIITQGVIGDKYLLLNIAVISLIISIISIVLSRAVFAKDKIASHIIGALAVFVPAIILLQVVSVIFAY